jgi:hypothetical protein
VIGVLEEQVVEVCSPAPTQPNVRGVGDEFDVVEEGPRAEFLRDARRRRPRAGEPGRDVDQGDEEPLREQRGVTIREPGG